MWLSDYNATRCITLLCFARIADVVYLASAAFKLDKLCYVPSFFFYKLVELINQIESILLFLEVSDLCMQ